jgi:hypothetical protein
MTGVVTTFEGMPCANATSSERIAWFWICVAAVGLSIFAVNVSGCVMRMLLAWAAVHVVGRAVPVAPAENVSEPSELACVVFVA